MLATAVFPGRYVQGPGALAAFGAEAGRIARRVVALADASLPATVLAGLDTTGTETALLQVPAACTEAAIARYRAEARALGAQAIAGLGGGKVVDLGRAVADDLGLPLLSVPTVAASDAPCSSLSVIYDDAGQVLRDRFVRSNPRLVLVDSAVIAAAPPRFLAAGIGDALATWYEAEACRRSGAANVCGGRATLLALAAARLCRDVVLADGAAALAEMRAGTPGAAFERVVEANILLSGLGFESGGVAAAHAIHHGLAQLPGTHGALHGEKVAFGVLVELALNDAPGDELLAIARFNLSVGLPVTLADLGLTDPAAALPVIVARALRKGEILWNEPVPPTPASVSAAILRADAAGQQAKGMP